MRLALGLVVVLAVTLAGAAPLQAQSLDPASAAALAATLRLLQDPGQRGPAIAGNPQAAAVDKQMQAVLGSPELQQEFYALAADVFAELAQSVGGDVGKMTQALEAGRTDPAGFAATLSPRTLERLRALSSKIADRMR
jgi:hypothetical protein